MSEPIGDATAGGLDLSGFTSGRPTLVDGPLSPWSDLAPHPVRRWIARQFDSFVTTGVVFAAVATPWFVLTPQIAFAPAVVLGLIYVFGPLRGFANAFLNALLLSRTSTTPGKWLCGVRMVRKDGNPLTYGLALKREIDAVFLGCGLYLPLLNLIGMGVGCARLVKRGAADWDDRLDLAVLQRPNGAKQTGLTLVAFVVFTVVYGGLALLMVAAGAARAEVA